MISRTLTAAAALLLLFLTACDVPSYLDRRADRRYAARGGEHREAALPEAILSYRTLGKADAPPLLLVHGFGANPRLQWTEQLGPLSKKYRLIVPELVFFGDSRPATERRVYSPEFQADQLKLLLDTLGIERIHILGSSYGGLVASLFSVKYPGQVDKVILCDAPVKFYRSSYADSLAAAAGRQRMDELLLPAAGADLAALLELTYHQPPRVKAETLDTLVQRYYFNQRREKQELLNYLRRSATFLNQLSYRTGRPVLLIWGEHDELIPVEVGRRLQSHLGPGTALTLIPGAGHAPNLEKPKAFNKAVLEYLAPPKKKKKGAKPDKS